MRRGTILCVRGLYQLMGHDGRAWPCRRPLSKAAHGGSIKMRRARRLPDSQDDESGGAIAASAGELRIRTDRTDQDTSRKNSVARVSTSSGFVSRISVESMTDPRLTAAIAAASNDGRHGHEPINSARGQIVR